MLRVALGVIGTQAAQTSLCVEAGENLEVTITETGPQRWSADGDQSARDFSPLLDRAGQAGLKVEIEPVADGTRLAWSFPLRPSLSLP